MQWLEFYSQPNEYFPGYGPSLFEILALPDIGRARHRRRTNGKGAGNKERLGTSHLVCCPNIWETHLKRFCILRSLKLAHSLIIFLLLLKPVSNFVLRLHSASCCPQTGGRTRGRQRPKKKQLDRGSWQPNHHQICQYSRLNMQMKNWILDGYYCTIS